MWELAALHWLQDVFRGTSSAVAASGTCCAQTLIDFQFFCIFVAVLGAITCVKRIVLLAWYIPWDRVELGRGLEKRITMARLL